MSELRPCEAKPCKYRAQADAEIERLEARAKAAERDRQEAWADLQRMEHRYEATLTAVREYRDRWAPNSPIYQDLDAILDREGE